MIQKQSKLHLQVFSQKSQIKLLAIFDLCYEKVISMSKSTQRAVNVPGPLVSFKTALNVRRAFVNFKTAFSKSIDKP